MTPTPITKPEPGGHDTLAAHSRLLTAADTNDVMREQLDFLIEHAEGGPCGCTQCFRYQRARSVLLEIFR